MPAFSHWSLSFTTHCNPVLLKIKVELPVTEEAGEDVASGVVTIDSDRLYKLIRLPVTGNHLLKLKFLDDNLELYAFTFG